MSANPLRTLGDRVRWARKESKLTQVQLAAKAGIGQSALSSLETGDTKWTRGPNLLRLAVALDVDAEWLLSGAGPPRSRANPADYQFADILTALTPDNRRRLLSVGHALLADQIANGRASTANPYPDAPLPKHPRRPAKTTP